MQQKVANKIMLITYPDSIGKDFHDLDYFLTRYYEGAIGGLHILPFFPSSADRGFSPITYKEVDSAFGDWKDIMNFAQKYYLMYDYMINHISDESEVFKDFVKNKDKSKYWDFFIKYKDFWKNGNPTKEEDAILYKRKEHPYVDVRFEDGSVERIWSTFSDHQMDINIQRSEVAKDFMKENLSFLGQHGAALIRLDAFAYATKKAGTDCFFVEPDVWDLIDECRKFLAPYGVEVLPEIHENYFIQKKLEERGYWTYDFQLPMLIINAFFTGRTMYLKNWMTFCPRKQFTTLDTHDGIGVVDVRYLLPDDELLKTKQHVFEINPNITEVYAKTNRAITFSSFDTYQINCTYFSALGEDERKYLISRAVQFFAPGIPQVYYCGLFASRNDFDLFHKTGEPRNVNRHYYSLDDIEKEMERPVVKALKRLMLFRNNHPSFNGTFTLLTSDEHSVRIRWQNGVEYSELYANFKSLEYRIIYSDNAEEKILEVEE